MSVQANGRVRLCGNGRAGGERKPVFEMLVLGCGGGPVGSNLSSYLVKPAARKWSEGCTGLEGGSTLGAIVALAERDPDLFSEFSSVGEEDDDLQSRGRRRTRRINGGAAPQERVETVRQRQARAHRTGGIVWDSINCFLITHGHLDHIAGLVISSALCRPRVKPVYGVEHTIANIERAMDGGVWPVLGGREDLDGTGKGKGIAYEYRVFEAPSTRSRTLSPSLSFTAFPIAHGPNPSSGASAADPSSSSSRSATQKTTTTATKTTTARTGRGSLEQEVYCSTAAFVKDEETKREFLFFGDVEPDSVSGTDLNHRVWAAAAPKILDRTLDTIFLECSYPSAQPRELLFGHLSPPFLMEELDVLADEVRKRQAAAAAAATRIGAQEEPDEGSEMPPPLEGVTVVIMHIKDELYPTPRPRPPPSSKPQPVRLETETAAVAAADPSSSSSNSGPRRSPRLGSAQPSSLASGSLPTGKDEDEDAEEEEAEEEGEDDDDETVQERIERELNELERTRRTGVKFLLAQQGMRIEF